MHISKNDSSIRMLVIDDAKPTFLVEDMVENIQKSFPLAKIGSVAGFDGIEDVIIKGQYNVIFLDASLHNWKAHEVFGNYGGNLIPFIKKESPSTFIVATSSDSGFNEEMIKRGAHGYIKKTHLDNPLKEITESLTVEE